MKTRHDVLCCREKYKPETIPWLISLHKDNAFSFRIWDINIIGPIIIYVKLNVEEFKGMLKDSVVLSVAEPDGDVPTFFSTLRD